MAGIYVHIPFCKQACHYCDFHFSTNLKYKQRMVDALVKEIGLRSDYLGGESISTLYFGGGSPGILEADLLAQIIDAVYQHFNLKESIELTLETNPDDMNPDTLDAWKSLGVNRLSVGIQSFIEDRLQDMNRAHSAEQSLACIAAAQEAGFDNLTIDLIYGLPDMHPDEWQSQLDQALGLGIQHISAYCLTLEPNTVYGKRHERGEMKAVDEEAASEQFLALRIATIQAGFDHYEVSNFGLPGFHSQHNSAYWAGTHYLGIGPSAHSFDGRSRQWNVSNNALHMKAIEQGELDHEREAMLPSNLYNERLMTGLRTSAGVDTNRLRMMTEYDVLTRSKSQIDQFCREGLMRIQNQHLILTPAGLLRADGIASELFIIDP